MAAEKRTIATPSQIVRDLPREIPLPAPIILQTSSETAAPPYQTSESLGSASNVFTTNNPKPAQAQAVIPAEDLKPLYDFTLDCKACQASLAAAQGDLSDEKSKTAALTKERDHALQIARGGSAWRRIGRAAKWFLIGAVAGAVAAKAAH